MTRRAQARRRRQLNRALRNCARYSKPHPPMRLVSVNEFRVHMAEYGEKAHMQAWIRAWSRAGIMRGHARAARAANRKHDRKLLKLLDAMTFLATRLHETIGLSRRSAAVQRSTVEAT